MATPSRRPFGKTEITVAGLTVKIDVDSDLSIGDVDSDMSRVSAHMAFWGDVYASSKEEEIAIDGHYRHWRAGLGNEILRKEEKIAEWKVKSLIESSPEFLEFKLRIGKCSKNTELARVMFESYRLKAQLLQSKGANMRAEISTPTASRSYAPPKHERDSTNSSYDTEDDDDDLDDELLEDDEEIAILPLPKSAPDETERLSKMKSIFTKGKK